MAGNCLSKVALSPCSVSTAMAGSMRINYPAYMTKTSLTINNPFTIDNTVDSSTYARDFSVSCRGY